jgi:hypothetical protein
LHSTDATVPHAIGVVDIKFIQPVIKIEQVVHEVIAYTKMEAVRVGITSGGEFTSFETHELDLLSPRVLGEFEKPPLRLSGHTITVDVET